MLLMERCDGATLLQLIKDWILPGTHIISDGWRAYKTSLFWIMEPILMMLLS